MKTTPPSASEIDSGSVEGEGVRGEVLRRAMRAGIEYYRGIQDDDGHWASDYGGPMFLMPGLIIAARVMGKTEEIIGERRRVEMLRYLENHLNEDGGVGLHIEGHSTMFGTVLTYVALRLLGKPSSAPECRKARKWIIDRGGATQVPSWGKFWLAVLGVYEWSGLNPVPPECWLLPYWLPVHPGRYWCHCRMVYLPMSYLYGIRATATPCALTAQLKKELYAENSYDDIDWNSARNACAAEDLYYPHPWIQDALWGALMKLEPFLLGSRLRRAACADAMRQIHYEDENTRYVDIGPVNKVFNMLCCWFEDRSGFGRGEETHSSHRGLSLGVGGRHEDARIQRESVVGLRVQRASHRRDGIGGRVRRVLAARARLHREESSARRLSGREEVVSSHIQGCVAFQHARSRMADLRLFVRGSQGGAHVGVDGQRARRRGDFRRASLRLRQRHSLLPKPKHGRVGDVREHAFVRVGRMAQSGRDVRRHHD